jgi:hypothetical protein
MLIVQIVMIQEILVIFCIYFVPSLRYYFPCFLSYIVDDGIFRVSFLIFIILDWFNF